MIKAAEKSDFSPNGGTVLARVSVELVQAVVQARPTASDGLAVTFQCWWRYCISSEGMALVATTVGLGGRGETGRQATILLVISSGQIPRGYAVTWPRAASPMPRCGVAPAASPVPWTRLSPGSSRRHWTARGYVIADFVSLPRFGSPLPPSFFCRGRVRTSCFAKEFPALRPRRQFDRDTLHVDRSAAGDSAHCGPPPPPCRESISPRCGDNSVPPSSHTAGRFESPSRTN
jgi:hypothetical protein